MATFMVPSWYSSVVSVFLSLVDLPFMIDEALVN